MRGYLTALLFLVWLPVAACAEEPLVEVDFEENAAVPGQSLILRITVLVPTWMPKPVVFPSFEAPNLQVRLPEGSTGPTSRSIGGETWSGVSRRYFITPMVPGTIEIAGQELLITWADPGQTDPIESRVAMDPVVVEGVVPEGAEDLDPFVAANNLKLSREMPEIAGPLGAGDSLEVSVTAEIDGVSAIMLPPLLPEIALDGVALYRDEPVVSDRDDRGVVSGTRTERVTLLAESGGGAEVPEITLRWYNLKSKSVETATLDAISVEVDAPRAVGDRMDPRAVIGIALLFLVAAALAWVTWRRLGPRLQALLAARRARIEASEPFAYAQVSAAAKARDIGRLMQSLDVWATRCPTDPRDIEPLRGALSGLGAARYGREKSRDAARWSDVVAALEKTRASLRDARSAPAVLPPLNPTKGRAA